MKIYAKTSDKFYNHRLGYDSSSDRLKIPAASVKNDVSKFEE